MSLIFTLLAPNMDKSTFDCGNIALNNYFKKQASQDMRRGFATVIVASEKSQPNTTIGFYTLCAASILLNDLPEETICKMPRYPNVPAIRLGRLAVHQDLQGQHIGSLLMLDALKRSCLSELAWAVMLVDAKNDAIIHFYKKFLFQPFIDNKSQLWMHRKQVEKLIF